MRKYDSYKDSEIEWLREIPEHWKIKRIKDIIKSIGSGITPKGGSEVYVDKGITFLRSQNIFDEGLRIDNVSFIDEKTHNSMKSSQLRPNDILVNITGASIARSCIVPNNIKKANINQHIIFIRTKSKYCQFTANYFKSNFVKEYINIIQAGTSKEALNMGQTLVIPIVIPNNFEQTQIAQYLDTKTQTIDKKVELLEQKIKHYKNLRKSLINKVVTKGLDKNVKLKDSGIDWIGKIPAHWELERLKHLGNLETSSVNKKIDQDEELVKLVNYMDVYNNNTKEIWNNENYMVVSANNLQIQSKKLKKGDVLFTPSSETIEDIGVSAVVMENLNNTLYSYHILRLRFSKKMDDSFKKYMFNNDFVQTYFSKTAKGTTRKILGLNDFNNLPVIVPPIKEQIEIGKFLDTKTNLITSIISNIENQITTLKELRKTLINDVVTGKIKVAEP